MDHRAKRPMEQEFYPENAQPVIRTGIHFLVAVRRKSRGIKRKLSSYANSRVR